MLQVGCLKLLCLLALVCLWFLLFYGAVALLTLYTLLLHWPWHIYYYCEGAIGFLLWIKSARNQVGGKYRTCNSDLISERISNQIKLMLKKTAKGELYWQRASSSLNSPASFSLKPNVLRQKPHVKIVLVLLRTEHINGA